MLTMEMQKNGRVQSRFSLQKPLFDRFFRICTVQLHRPESKSAPEKYDHTDTQTDRQYLTDLELGRGPFSDTQNADTVRKISQNRSLKSKLRFS